MNEAVRVMIADDHALVREGLMMFLSDVAGDIEVVAQATDGLETLELARRLRPDVILMDLVMPRLDGIEVTRRLREEGVPSRILILTSFANDQSVRDALRAGATGYLLKDLMKDELVEAIHAAAAGKTRLHPEAQQHLVRQVCEPEPSSPLDALTNRELDVLRLIAGGHSNKQIAAALFLSVGTVKGHVSAILSKLDLADRTQAALYATKNGLDPGIGGPSRSGASDDP